MIQFYIVGKKSWQWFRCYFGRNDVFIKSFRFLQTTIFTTIFIELACQKDISEILLAVLKVIYQKLLIGTYWKQIILSLWNPFKRSQQNEFPIPRFKNGSKSTLSFKSSQHSSIYLAKVAHCEVSKIYLIENSSPVRPKGFKKGFRYLNVFNGQPFKLDFWTMSKLNPLPI